MQTTKLVSSRRPVITFLLAVSAATLLPLAARSDEKSAQSGIGKELFTREWLPNDKRSFAGDGLGPVHNARSCVACHNQGGVGGAGGKGSNSVIVSAFVSFPGKALFGTPVEDDPSPATPYGQPDRTKLAEVHPALGTGRSFVLFRHGSEKAFDVWKAKFSNLLERSPSFPETITIGNVLVSLIPSERNPPSLFGTSLIDRIPDEALDAIAKEQASTAGPAVKPFSYQRTLKYYPIPVSGRVLRHKDGRIGRFGWKNSVATAREFVLMACANEIGLEVPGFPRAAPPWLSGYKAPGLDLNHQQAVDLVSFVTTLPRPVTKEFASKAQATKVNAGKLLFGKIGCANCHRPKLGDVDGIYSDLLLHDMGQSLSGAGSYETTLEVAPSLNQKNPLPVQGNFVISRSNEILPKFGAGAREWRTPPLWGLHNSIPYLHDGRAPTIEVAIKQHNGEGLLAAQAFAKLSQVEQTQLCMFLDSLTAPVQAP